MINATCTLVMSNLASERTLYLCHYFFLINFTAAVPFFNLYLHLLLHFNTDTDFIVLHTDTSGQVI